MARKTLAEKRIDVIITSYDLAPADVLELTRIMLESYRDVKGNENSSMPSMTPKEILKQKQEMRRELLRLMKKDIKRFKAEQEKFIVKAIRAPWMWEKIEYLLDKVADFSDQGKNYKKILLYGYLKGVMTNEQLEEAIPELGENTITYRKREAIKLFGIYIWDYALRRENEDIVAGIVDKDTDDDHPMRRKTDRRVISEEKTDEDTDEENDDNWEEDDSK